MTTIDELGEVGANQSTALVAAERQAPDAYLERLHANLAIAEQTLSAVRELKAGLPTPTSSRKTSLALSIVIPVYNERDTIVEIVRRVQAVGVHSEIIIVDDFSTDGTRDLLLQLQRDSDIRVFMNFALAVVSFGP